MVKLPDFRIKQRRPVATKSAFPAILVPLYGEAAAVEFVVVIVHRIGESKPEQRTFHTS
jgi:hypothetical protein